MSKTSSLTIAMVGALWLGPMAVPLHAQQAGAPPDQDPGTLSLEQLLQVEIEGAALHTQSLKDAPASVTVITQDDIRTFGYHTLAEALSDVRGMFTTYDHIYHFEGVRGFGLPGDYGTRLLLLVNGHNLTDNVLGQSVWFGQDFPLDMNLIKRIEVIRGPASALYGSNGLFATINVVTFSPHEFKGTQLRTETGTLGEGKLQGASSLKIGDNASLLLSASILRSNGQHSIYVPEYDAPDTNFGRAVGVDGERGYHLFGNLTWHDWNFSALYGGRDKHQVISWGPTVFNDPATRSSDAPNFADASYTHAFDTSRSLHWRTYFDSYRFRGVFRYAHEDGVQDNSQLFSGDWAGSQIDYRFAVPYLGSLTLGAVGQIDLRALMQSVNLTPVREVLLSINGRDRFGAVFAQDELNLAAHLKFNLGARFDYSHNRRDFVSPRAALIYQPSAQTSYKLLYGKAFRNPTAFELFYTDLEAQTIGNPRARAETSQTVEAVVEQRIAGRLNGILSAYHYRIEDLLVADYTPEGLLQYHNTADIPASGVEIELNGRPADWLELVASMAIQRAVKSTDHTPLANSPKQMAKLRASVPLFNGRMSLAGSAQYTGTRQTLTGATLPAGILTDIVLSTNRLTSNIDAQLGMRNVGNAKYLNPLALNSKVDTLVSAGRSLFFSFTWRPTN
jgi:outer membrane receptor for ferrienterochelin and colicins